MEATGGAVSISVNKNMRDIRQEMGKPSTDARIRQAVMQATWGKEMEEEGGREIIKPGSKGR